MYGNDIGQCHLLFSPNVIFFYKFFIWFIYSLKPLQNEKGPKKRLSGILSIPKNIETFLFCQDFSIWMNCMKKLEKEIKLGETSMWHCPKSFPYIKWPQGVDFFYYYILLTYNSWAQNSCLLCFRLIRNHMLFWDLSLCQIWGTKTHI